jgi:hypothetical protein
VGVLENWQSALVVAAPHQHLAEQRKPLGVVAIGLDHPQELSLGLLPLVQLVEGLAEEQSPLDVLGVGLDAAGRHLRAITRATERQKRIRESNKATRWIPTIGIGEML